MCANAKCVNSLSLEIVFALQMFVALGPGSFLVFCEILCFLSVLVYCVLWMTGRTTPKHIGNIIAVLRHLMTRLSHCLGQHGALVTYKSVDLRSIVTDVTADILLFVFKDFRLLVIVDVFNSMQLV